METESILNTLKIKYIGKEVLVYHNTEKVLVTVNGVLASYDTGEVKYILKCTYNKKKCNFYLSNL